MDWINKIHFGHALDILKTLPDNSVDCCLTSPPYWAMRNYATQPAFFPGTKKDCEHVWKEKQHNALFASSKKCDKVAEKSCEKCGAWVGELGSESDISLYVEHLCMVFDEVARVLKNAGTLWVNISDTYSRRPFAYYDKTGKKYRSRRKSLLLIPFRFATAMMDRGWTIRNTIIWQKTNCIPSSAKDRFTPNFEYIFFFTKQTKYFFKQQLEPLKETSLKRCHYGCNNNKGIFYQGMTKKNFENFQMQVLKGHVTKKNKRTIWDIPSAVSKYAHFATFPEKLAEIPINAGCPDGGIVLDPFVGSGTTAVVAKGQGKNFVGIELNPEYIKIAEDRIEQYNSKNAF